MLRNFTAYSPLPQANDADGSSEKLLDDTGDIETAQKQGSNPKLQCIVVCLTLAGVIIAFVAIVSSLTFWRPTCASGNPSLSGLYSPANVSVEYNLVQFNGTFGGLKSPYIGTPSPEIDAAWDRITMGNRLNIVRLPGDYYQRMSMPGHPSNVRFHEEDGGGYMGAMDVFHVLHCLDMLRKFTYLEYYPGLQETQRTRPVFFREHVDHCIDTLRQNIMCAGDIAVVTYDWVEDHDKPFPNFNSYHKCRNFEKILDWTHENTLQIPLSHVTRIGDEVDLPEKAVDLDGVLNIQKNFTPV